MEISVKIKNEKGTISPGHCTRTVIFIVIYYIHYVGYAHQKKLLQKYKF